MKKFIIAAGLAAFSVSFSVTAADYSPAIQASLDIAQSEFRGYKPGNKEMKGKLQKLGKIATADEMEQVMKGEKKDWIIVDIRNDTQYKGGHIVVDGKPMLSVGRLQPTSILEKAVMEIKDKKEITKAAPKNIIIMCRSGMKSTFDYASYAIAGFNDVKIAGIATWAKACKPLTSSTDIKDAGLMKKKINMKQHTDGLYYADTCPVFK